ncbi:hypothetical protein E4656_11020 [Natronospirillum operosum]|uniref:Uncharacterized protein n=1 Tax=Natronospirillum operosum TaxID=2759953 RepID=A0A4Z0W836_9GAMM|nr:hypothetical protein [Natronospirillum operosum]TGG93567.1 hypothetical protein E4656_11020 [Natronospirillum operosum]
MTIGIAAVGPDAGAAILEGLAAAETIGEGALGGFVSFAAVSAVTGRVHRHGVQRQGSVSLLHVAQGDPAGLQADRAALMSSGPDRPEPLAQFVSANAHGCLVTGHRFPNTARGEGDPANAQVLRLLSEGQSAELAVKTFTRSNPMADAGFIAVDARGELFIGNCARVEQRRDLGQALASAPGGLQVAVTHNAIWPTLGLAELVAQIVLRKMQTPPSLRTIRVAAGTPVRYGHEDAVFLTAAGDSVSCIQTCDASLLTQAMDGAAIYANAPVYIGTRCVGQVFDEPYTRVSGSRINSLDGADTLNIRYQVL